MSAKALLPGRLSLPSKTQQSVIFFMVVAPFLLTLLAPFLWLKSFVTTAALIQVPIWYFLTVQAVTVSFHRELTHGSVSLKPVARYVEIFLALLSLEGTTLDWCARHRMHHNYADEVGDPHSPYGFGPGVIGVLKGFLHSHVGWLFKEGRPDYSRYVPDLQKDKGLVFLDSLFPLLAVLTFVLPGAISYLFVPTLKGFLTGVFWGGFVRVFLVHHVTWSINSVCHLWGTRPFKSNDGSVNNFIFGIIGFGEGWHRNHHAFKWSARIGLRWWEFDIGWYVITLLSFFGLVISVNVPGEDQIKKKEITVKS